MHFTLHPDGCCTAVFSCGIGVKHSRVFLHLDGVRVDCLTGCTVMEEPDQENSFGRFRRFQCRKQSE